MTKQRLPGMPGPSQQAVDRSRRLESAFNTIHEAILPLLESLPVGGDSRLTIRKNVRGDMVAVTVRPGKEEVG